LRISLALHERRQGVPQPVIDIADRAMHRLGRKAYKMRERGLSSKKIVTALARELAGFLWAAATCAVDSVPPGPRGRHRGPVVATDAGLPHRDGVAITRRRSLSRIN